MVYNHRQTAFCLETRCLNRNEKFYVGLKNEEPY